MTALVIDLLVAEKVRALLMPGKPRDLYDIWLLQRQGVEPDLTVVDRELALYDQEWKRDAIEEALEGVRPEWKQDLRPLLPKFVLYEVIHADLETLLN